MVLAGFTWSSCTIPIVDGVGTFPLYLRQNSFLTCVPIRFSVHGRTSFLCMVSPESKPMIRFADGDYRRIWMFRRYFKPATYISISVLLVGDLTYHESICADLFQVALMQGLSAIVNGIRVRFLDSNPVQYLMSQIVFLRHRHIGNCKVQLRCYCMAGRQLCLRSHHRRCNDHHRRFQSALLQSSLLSPPLTSCFEFVQSHSQKTLCRFAHRSLSTLLKPAQ